MSMFQKICGCLAAAFVFTAAEAATINVAGYDIEESNFADGADLRFGGGRIFQPGRRLIANDTNFSSALSGSSARDGFLCETKYCEFDVFFDDGGLMNGAGDDLLIYGLGDGADEFFAIIINGVRVSGFELFDTGQMIADTNYALVALAINLDLWGLENGVTISSIRIVMLVNNKEEFSGFAALNSDLTSTNELVAEASIPASINAQVVETPIPAAFLLFGSGLAGLFGANRKRKKS